MPTRTTRKWRFTIPAALVALLLASSFGVAGAFNPQPEPPGITAVGMTETQTASLTAVNVAERGECEVLFEYRDASGEILAAERLTVEPGTFSTLEFHPPDPVEPPTSDIPARLQVRGVVTPLTPQCELGTTLEIYDNETGKTTIAVNEMVIDG
jgi:hypothetical protein